MDSALPEGATLYLDPVLQFTMGIILLLHGSIPLPLAGALKLVREI